MTKHLLKAKPRLCPHPDCGQSFDYVEMCNGIVFCPHCQKSLLVNPLTQKIQSQSLGQFFGNYIKAHYKTLLIICLIIVFMDVLLGYVSDFAGFTLIGMIMFGFMVFLFCYFRLDIKKRTFYDLSKSPFYYGVDKLDTVKNANSQHNYQETLDKLFYPFAGCCPHCQSQRISHRIDNRYYCNNCQSELLFNKTLSLILGIRAMVLVAIIIVYKAFVDYDNDGLLWVIVLGASLLITNLIFRFIFIKSKKWLI